jgi:CopG family nickel-responsive transcriptional regulator
MTVVSVSLPEELVERLDAFATEHGSTGPSEVGREAARSLLGEVDEPSLEGRDLLGVVTVRLDYRSTALEQDLLALRHEHDGLVASNVHDHVGDRYCMERSILEGSLADVAAFVQAIRATAEALSVDDAVRPVDQVDVVAGE